MTSWAVGPGADAPGQQCVVRLDHDHYVHDRSPVPEGRLPPGVRGFAPHDLVTESSEPGEREHRPLVEHHRTDRGRPGAGQLPMQGGEPDHVPGFIPQQRPRPAAVFEQGRQQPHPIGEERRPGETPDRAGDHAPSPNQRSGEGALAHAGGAGELDQEWGSAVRSAGDHQSADHRRDLSSLSTSGNERLASTT